VVINEFLASNDSTITDRDGDYSDWVELYNKSEDPIDLSGYSLSDDALEPQKWTFPSVQMEAHSYLLVYCSDKDRVDAELHANFKLDKEGEFLSLSSPDGAFIDSLRYPLQEVDVSMGRLPDGNGDFYYFTSPTPLRSNENSNSSVRLTKPDFAVSSGLFEQNFSVSMTSAQPQAIIHFTLDGSEPTASDKLYNQPITINRTTVVRARAFLSGFAASDIRSNIYILNMPSLDDIPILSIMTDPENLWNSTTGIVANAMETGDAWERPVTLDYIGGNESFNLDAGLRIHGGASRSASQKKSFRLYFRSDYGPAKLEYPILPGTDLDEFDDLVLRGGFNDSWPHRYDYQRESTTYLRDQLVMDLFRKMGHLSTHGDFVHVFLNDEYWGVYNLIERYDQDFMDHYVGNGDWLIIKAREIDGSMTAWHEFENWFSNANFARASTFAELKEHVHLDNLVDYYILNIWIQNVDWPNNNWYIAKNLSEANSKWIFLPWDSEHTLGGGWGRSQYTENVLKKINESQGAALGNFLGQLRRSSQFRQLVSNRFDYLTTSVLSEEHVLQHLDSLVQRVETAMDYESDRWGYVFAPEYTYTRQEWQRALQTMQSFIRNRTDVVWEHLVDFYFPEPQTHVDEKQASSLPDSHQLEQNYPNPFNNTTRLTYHLAYADKVELTVFNLRGERVRRLVEKRQTKGEYQVTWDGHDFSGRVVPSGIYFYQLKTDQSRHLCKMMVCH
jgi:hypothetical protein